MSHPKYPPHELLSRIKAWCDRQERAHQETRDKLYSWGLHHDQVENLISELITENYLNEERFARAYSSGKFRIKGWGWKKIEQGLKNKRISAYCIKQAKEEIEDKEYLDSLTTQLEKKSRYLKESNSWIRQSKLANFMIRRGFESDIVWDIINSRFNE